MIYWSYTNLQIEETKTTNDMVDKAYIISQVWFREGTPEYWDSTNVLPREIGLLSDHKINETKMDEMKKLGYNTVKDRIGAAPYEFQFFVTKVDDVVKQPIAYINSMPATDLAVLYILNESDLVWDFYWASPLGTRPETTARKAYSGTETEILGKLIANIDEYNTIISEKFNPNDPVITGLTEQEKEKFRSFVNTSKHVYLHIWNNLKLLEILNSGLQPENPTQDSGIVNELDPIIKDSKVGDEIRFKQGTFTFDKASSPLPVKSIANVSGDPTNCAICRWTYGNGTIYFLIDACGQGGGCQYITNLNTIEYSFVFGKYPTNASNVIRVERAGVLNSSIAIIEVLLWR